MAVPGQTGSQLEADLPVCAVQLCVKHKTLLFCSDLRVKSAAPPLKKTVAQLKYWSKADLFFKFFYSRPFLEGWPGPAPAKDFEILDFGREGLAFAGKKR